MAQLAWCSRGLCAEEPACSASWRSLHLAAQAPSAQADKETGQELEGDDPDLADVWQHVALAEPPEGASPPSSTTSHEEECFRQPPQWDQVGPPWLGMVRQ